ncbi:hypothetical protein OQA88_3131 [Cercophora sp. LCS_1]
MSVTNEEEATFFVNAANGGKGQIQDESTGFPAIIKRMHSEGHQIGSHSWSHENLAAISPQQRRDQIIKNEISLVSILGFFPTYFRVPFSSWSDEVFTDLNRFGYHSVSFDLDTRDTEEPNLKSNYQLARDSFTAAVSKHSPADTSFIAVSHDIQEKTVRGYAQYMIDQARLYKYELVTVGECLGDHPNNWYRDPATGGQFGGPPEELEADTTLASKPTEATGRVASSTKTVGDARTTNLADPGGSLHCGVMGHTDIQFALSRAWQEQKPDLGVMIYHVKARSNFTLGLKTDPLIYAVPDESSKEILIAYAAKNNANTLQSDHTLVGTYDELAKPIDSGAPILRNATFLIDTNRSRATPALVGALVKLLVFLHNLVKANENISAKIFTTSPYKETIFWVPAITRAFGPSAQPRDIDMDIPTNHLVARIAPSEGHFSVKSVARSTATPPVELSINFESEGHARTIIRRIGNTSGGDETMNQIFILTPETIMEEWPKIVDLINSRRGSVGISIDPALRFTPPLGNYECVFTVREPCVKMVWDAADEALVREERAWTVEEVEGLIAMTRHISTSFCERPVPGEYSDDVNGGHWGR